MAEWVKPDAPPPPPVDASFLTAEQLEEITAIFRAYDREINASDIIIFVRRGSSFSTLRFNASFFFLPGNGDGVLVRAELVEVRAWNLSLVAIAAGAQRH